MPRRTLLRKLTLATLTLSLTLTNLIAQNAYPLNFDDTTLKTAINDISNWNGKIVACDVEVLQVEKGYQDKSYYKVKLEKGSQMWVGDLFNNGFEKPGSKLRILGYFAKVESDDKLKKFNKNSYHILTIGVVDLATKQMAALPAAERQVKEWSNGEIPKGKK